MTSPLITKAKSENIPAIRAMVNAAYTKYIDRIGKRPAPMNADYDELMQDHEIYVLQTESDPTVVGSIVLGIDEATNSVKINNLVVDPTSQRKGHGRVLMTFAERFAKEKGRPALTLFTNVKMYENLSLYPKMGFVETERKTEEGYERVYFRKDL